MEKNYDVLKLDNQLCFPLYAVSKEIVRRYKPFLDEIDLTYTQYITMMVMWENKRMSVQELGQKLFLDSGTLTPLLKRLEQKGLLTRQLKAQAVLVPEKMMGCVPLEPEDAKNLYCILHKMMDGFQGE